MRCADLKQTVGKKSRGFGDSSGANAGGNRLVRPDLLGRKCGAKAVG